jgi:nucleotide-binding universal stress UspA family protein
LSFKKILVPYDGSRPADNALNQAIKLAKMSEDIEITLLYVLPEFPMPPMFEKPTRSKTGKVITGTEYLNDMYQEMRSNALKTLYEKKQKCEDIGVFTIKTHIMMGNPSNGIVKLANGRNFDLIIIGKRSVKGISKFIKGLGSVSRSVVERAPCPVMVVR